jgi:hypothetical protein
VAKLDHAAAASQVAADLIVTARSGTRYLTKARAQIQQRLYTLVPAPSNDPSVPDRLPVTVRSDRELSVGNQIWVQGDCWEMLESHSPLDDTPERAAFLCDTSPQPRARIVAGAYESWLYEPDLLDLDRAVVVVHADETPTTRTIRAAIRAALYGSTGVEANLEGDALRILAQAIRGHEISSGLSPALQQLGGNLSHHFYDLKAGSLARAAEVSDSLKRR